MLKLIRNRYVLPFYYLNINNQKYTLNLCLKCHNNKIRQKVQKGTPLTPFSELSKVVPIKFISYADMATIADTRLAAP